MMLVSSSGWAHSPITLIFTALSAVYGAALALDPAPSSTASADSRTKPVRLTSLSLTLAPLRTTSNREPIPAFRRLSSPCALPSINVRLPAGLRLALILAIPASGQAAPTIGVTLAKTSVRYGAAHTVDGTLLYGT